MTKKNKLRPCDCIDHFTANKLNEQGIGHNDEGIEKYSKEWTGAHLAKTINRQIVYNIMKFRSR